MMNSDYVDDENSLEDGTKNISEKSKNNTKDMTVSNKSKDHNNNSTEGCIVS